MRDDQAPSSGERLEPSDYGFLQGTVKAWDSVAGTNTVRVRGKDFENLTVLMGSESGLLQEEDSVIVLRLNNTYAVLGRLASPGTPQRALELQSDTVLAAETSTSGTYGNLTTVGPSVVVDIGSSRRCLVFASAQVQVNNASGNMSFEVTGNSSIDPTDQPIKPVIASSVDDFVGSLATITSLTAADGLQVGHNVFTAKYRRPTGASASFADRNLFVLPY